MIFLEARHSQAFQQTLGLLILFICEESSLQQVLGSKAILEFLKLHGNPYTHIFADPDSNNVAAVKCYERAGFKKVSEQADTGEVWMIKDLSLRNDPLPTIQKLIKERYVQAKAIFWAGSVSEGRGTSASDLDLVIVFEEVPTLIEKPLFTTVGLLMHLFMILIPCDIFLKNQGQEMASPASAI
ncbi:nucleotidyltransferase domain-containing protein [Orientia tsutsugamushi]|uniref:nucleotidyltransferase domain-containing protein n=1 Tax=Orientia tsutsugamushi TaxID=784 RepID=UPI003527B529